MFAELFMAFSKQFCDEINFNISGFDKTTYAPFFVRGRQNRGCGPILGYKLEDVVFVIEDATDPIFTNKIKDARSA